MKVMFKSQKASGFTFIEMIIVITILGLLVAIGVPSYIRARDNSRLTLIHRNLRQIETAKTQWALDNKKTTGDRVADMSVLKDYFRSTNGLQDVVREKYVPNAIGTAAEADLPSGVSLGTNAPGTVIGAD